MGETIGKETKFSQYQLDEEGENYREVLITLPTILTITEKEKDELENLQMRMNNEVNFPEKDLQRLNELQQKSRQKDEKTLFKSTHFNEPNILAHLRMSERTDDNGNKVLFIGGNTIRFRAGI
jgi:hypothetical protein